MAAVVAAGAAFAFVQDARAQGSPTVSAVPIGAFSNPIHVAVAPGEESLLFVVERAGQIRVMRNENTLPRPFLDIRSIVRGIPDDGAGGEQGLLSVAFPQNYQKTRKFYVFFTNKKGDLEIDEFKRSKKRATRASVKSRRILLRIRHRDAQNHNGGQLQFGPDKRLYISTGDGGGGNDQFDNARKKTKLLGKILRINPRGKDKKNPYKIPKGNPFVGEPGRDEIFSYGLRNPWRFSFDGNRIAIADVGQLTWEEVNLLDNNAAKGANFGWPQYEGNELFDNDRPGADPVTFPVHVYQHTGGACSITGGYVMHDATIPDMEGRYIYGDWCTGEIRSFNAAGGPLDDQSAGITLNGVSSFGQGFDGQIYAVQLGGTVSRIEAP